MKVRSNILCITNSYHTLLFQKKMRFLFYVLLIFSVVSCSLNAIILNLIFGVCCSFLVLLNSLIILFHDLFFHAKIIDLSTKKMSSVKKHKIVFHLTSILLFLHISFTTTSFILASIIFKGKNQFPYFLFHWKLNISDRQMNNLEERQVEIDLTPWRIRNTNPLLWLILGFSTL